MAQFLLLVVVALVAGGLIFGVAALLTGSDRGLAPAEPDSSAVPLPDNRPLAEHDLAAARFGTALRGYRMDEVDAALGRVAYDLGYKQELIVVLESEVEALRAGRSDEAEALRAARVRAAARADDGGTKSTAGDTGAGAATDGSRPEARDEAVDEAAGTEAAPPEAADGSATRGDGEILDRARR